MAPVPSIITARKNYGPVCKNYGPVCKNYGPVCKNYGPVRINYGPVFFLVRKYFCYRQG